jgi:hypothetical protein
MNGGFEVLGNGSECHPDAAGAGRGFGVLSGAVEPNSYSGDVG